MTRPAFTASPWTASLEYEVSAGAMQPVRVSVYAPHDNDAVAIADLPIDGPRTAEEVAANASLIAAAPAMHDALRAALAFENDWQSRAEDALKAANDWESSKQIPNNHDA